MNNFDIEQIIEAVIGIEEEIDSYGLNGKKLISKEAFSIIVSPFYESELKQEIYRDISNKLSQISKTLQNNNSVFLNKESNSIELTVSNINEIKILLFNSFVESLESSKDIEGSFRKLLPSSKTPRYKFPNKIENLEDIIKDSEVSAEERLIGDPEVSLQIGYIKFDSSKLGPDSIVIVDQNEVSSTDTVRSSTDVAIKEAGSNLVVEIDLIFKNVNDINNDLRSLLGLLKLAPIVPLGGSAISAAIINRVTSLEVYKKLKSQIFNQSIKSKDNTESLETYNQFLNSMDEESKPSMNTLIELIGSERASYNVIKQIAEYEKNLEVKKDNFEASGFVYPDLKELFSSQTYLIPFVFKDITVSTIDSAIGALRVRLSFIKCHNTYSPNGDLLFIDKDGNPTYDINRCAPLINAVESIFLNPRRGIIADNKFISNGDWNNHYIPKIGDDTNINNNGISGIDLNLIEKSDIGYNLYKSIDGNTSPVLLRFNTPNNPTTLLEYIPYDLILKSVAWTQSNKVVPIPMEGCTYPTFQVMGKSLLIGSLVFLTSDRNALQKFMSIKNSMDKISSFESGSRLLRREFLDIYNDVLNLSGIKRFIISQVNIEASKDNPNLFHISVNLVGNYESINDVESIEINESTKSNSKELKEFWWYLYSSILTHWIRKSGLSGAPTTIGGISSFNDFEDNLFKLNVSTNEEIKLIWDLVFGRINSNSKKYEEGFIENNILTASFLDLIFKGYVGQGKTKLNSYQNQYIQNPNGEFKENDKDFADYLSKVIQRSKAGAEANITKVFNDRLTYGGSHDLLSVESFMPIIQLLYGNEKITPWWYSVKNSSDFIAIIEKHLIDGPNDEGYFDNSITKGILLTNTYDNPQWVPSPALWDALFNALMYPNKYKSERITDENGQTPGYMLTSFTDEPAFYITNKWKKMRNDLNLLLSYEDFKNKFKSFWIHKVNTPANIETIKASEGLKFNPFVYEYRNNYKDIHLPRYVEIFSSKDGNPLTDKTGVEVWRKVAPTYLEMGIAPDIFVGIAKSDPKQLNINPGFLTNKSFFDYCEPGFFYFKKSWLLNSYNEIINQVSKEIDNGNFSSLHETETNKYNLPDQSLFDNGDNSIEIGSADVGITNILKREEVVKSNGVFTLGISQPSHIGNLADYIQEQIKLKPTTSTTGLSKEQIYFSKLKQGNIKSLRVIIGGQLAGCIVYRNKNNPSNRAKIIDIQIEDDNGTNRLVPAKEINIPTGPTAIVDKTDGYYFVNLTNFFPKDPQNIKYRDVNGLIQYNLYKKETAKTNLKSILDHIGDVSHNYVRAYPTFKLYFVREELVDGNVYKEYIESNSYGYSSVIDISITHDKEDASTAYIRLTDISGNLSQAVFEKDLISTDANPDDYNYDTPARLKLEIGTNIVIKFGYGQDPDSLKTVFTGSIAEIEPGDITNIIAQSYKTELFKFVNIYSSHGIADRIVDNVFLKRPLMPTCPEYLIYRTLCNLAQIRGVDKSFELSGLPHFGRFVNRAVFSNLSKEEQLELQNRITEYTDKLLETNTNTRPGGVLAAAGAGASVGLLGGVPGAAIGAVVGGGLYLAGVFDGVANWVAKYSDLNIHTNAMRNVFFSDDVISDGLFDFLGKEWVINSNGWQAIKEIARYKVGYICQEVPYGNKATLFVGRPDQFYHYKPVKPTELSAYAKAYPVATYGIFNVIYNDLIKDFLVSEEYGINIDYDAINYKLKSAFDKFNGLNNNPNANSISEDIASKVKNASKTIKIEDIVEGIKDPSVFGSFKFGDLVIRKIKKATNSEVVNIKPNVVNQKFYIGDSRNPGVINISIANKSNELIFVSTKKKADSFLAGGSPRENGIIGSTIAETFNLNLGSTYGLLGRDISYSNDFINLNNRINISNDTIIQAGQVIAVNSSGRLIGASELRSRFGIDPNTGIRIGDQVNPSEFEVVVASDIGTSYSAYGKNGKHLIRTESDEYIKMLSENVKLVLNNDNSDYYSSLKSYGADLHKLIFCLYFGIGFRKTGTGADTKIEIVAFNAEIEQLINNYCLLIMQGYKDSPEQFSIKMTSILNSLNKNKIKNDNNRSALQDRYELVPVLYSDLKSEPIIDSTNRSQAIESTRAILDQSLRERSITNEEYISAKANLDSFLENIPETFNFTLGNSFNDAFSDILVNNMDSFKLLLIFFSIYLRNNSSDLTNKLQASNNLLDLASAASPPGTKIFRDTHYIATSIDIIENNIKATMSHMANNVLLITPKEIEVNEQAAGEGQSLITVNEEQTEWIPYPNYQISGVDFNPYISPELRKQRQVKERNAESDSQKSALLINHMAEAIRPMYRGNIKIIGKVVKPYDVIVISDSYNDMYGIVEVERVVHNFNSQGGWTTTIIPHAYVNPLDESAEVARRFDTRMVDFIYKGITALEYAFTATMVWSILAAPAKIGAGIIGKQAAKQVASSTAATAAKTVQESFINRNFARLIASSFYKVAKQELKKTGVVKPTKDQIKKKAFELAATKSASSTITQMVYGVGSSALKEIIGKPGLSLAIGGSAFALSRQMVGMYYNMVTDWTLSSSTLPLHVYTLTKSGRPFQAGLDMQYQRFFNASERLGFLTDDIYQSASQFINEALNFTDVANSSESTVLKNILNR